MEAVLINESLQVRAQLGVDLLGSWSAAVLRAASTEALGKQADRYENLARTSTASWPSDAAPGPGGKAMPEDAPEGGTG
jgi:hypothetical protein